MEGLLIVQKGKSLRRKIWILSPLAVISSYICLIPLVLTDLFLAQFQWIYFGLHEIPKVKRKDYFAYDRHLLSKLNPVQKVHCIYCEYANGVVAYAKAVANQMEIYSCAIKHIHTPAGHVHQKNFNERQVYE